MGLRYKNESHLFRLAFPMKLMESTTFFRNSLPILGPNFNPLCHFSVRLAEGRFDQGILEGRPVVCR